MRCSNNEIRGCSKEMLRLDERRVEAALQIREKRCPDE